MDLSRTIGAMAVVLGVVAAAGYADGDDNVQAPGAKQVAEKKRVDEHKKRKEEFQRLCDRNLNSDYDFAACRLAYRRLIEAGPL